MDDWVRMYRQGITGAEITEALPDVDPLEVLQALVAANSTTLRLKPSTRKTLTSRTTGRPGPRRSPPYGGTG